MLIDYVIGMGTNQQWKEVTHPLLRALMDCPAFEALRQTIETVKESRNYGSHEFLASHIVIGICIGYLLGRPDLVEAE